MAVKKHVLIVGGGFGGVKTALDLSELDDLEITVVSDRPDFRYYPSLYHVATGAPTELSSIPLEFLFKDKNVNLIQATATKIDRKAQELILNTGKKIKYDDLVLALGVNTNYFGIQGLQEFSYGIKSIEEANELKAHLHRQLLDDMKPDLNYIIVGGGPTGIELAGELPAYLHHIMKKHGIRDRKVHVDLVEAFPQLLPRMPKKVGKAVARQLRNVGVKLYLNSKVEGETADALLVDGKSLSSHTVIWTAGIANSTFFSDNQFVITDHHKVAVNEYLEAEPHIYVIGDNADTKYSGMAQTAIYDAEFISHNFRFESQHSPRLNYRPKKPIYVIPAGPHWAAVEWGKVHIYGWLGWFLREAGDLVAFHDLEPVLEAGGQWLNEFRHDDECKTCGVAK